jgi:tetratricopeptide (TPR) repeat protein
MVRCPTCRRRVVPSGRCPADGAVAPPAPPEPGAQSPPRLKGYSAPTLLGAGGFGSVWQASDARGSVVAIKVSHGADREAHLRLERESVVLTRVGPPHVPALLGSGSLPDGRPYLVLERLLGHTLAQELERWTGPPPAARLRALAGALLESASAVHQAQVVHRDLKPENVFLVGGGAEGMGTRLMDFGLSRLPGVVESTDQTINVAGGTPEYMAPEQISGGPVDARADVYALGLLLYEMMTLRLPFFGDRRELEYAHLSFRAPRPSDFAPVPEAIEEVILRCLAKAPDLRFPHADAVRAAFLQALTLQPPEPTQPEVRPAAPVTRAAPAVGEERQKMVLIFAQGPRVSEAQAELEPFAGVIAHAQPGLAVYAFGHRAGHSPGQRALAAAGSLLARKRVERVVVDVGEVRVRPRPGGPRLFSGLFTDVSRYPSAADPPGILLTSAAYALVPALPCQPAPTRPDHFLLIGTDADRTQSRTRMPDPTAPMVGRSELLRGLLVEAVQALADRRPRVASVLAEPGFGKTRLAQELGQHLRRQLPGAEVVELTAREPLGNDSDANLAVLLRHALELPVEAPPEGGRDLLIDRLGEVGREVYASAALALRWIPPDHPAVTALRAVPGVLRANMARAGLAALRRLAARQPVLVVLDDAHWAEDTLLDALEQATASDLPLWVCAFARPGFAEGRPTWGQRAAHARLERLGPLDRESAAQLCRHLLQPATDVPETVIARLSDRAQGVPLLLCDLVRGLRREGLVRQHPGGGGQWYVATEVLDRLPDSPLAEWLASRELELLPPELSAHARLLSLLTPEISLDEVDGVLSRMDRDLAGAFPMDARVATLRLQQLGLILHHRTGSYGFRNGVLRDGVALGVAAALAGRVHRAALAFYRAAPLAEAARTYHLAWHAARAGERQEAGRAYLRLAESARERHSYLEADLLYSQALSQLDDKEEDQCLRALQGRGTMRYRLGRYDRALEDLGRARELAAHGGDPLVQADVMLDEAMALDWLWEFRRSRDLTESARDLVGEGGPPGLQARLTLGLGRSLHRFNRDEDAVPVLRQAAALARAMGDQGYEVQVTAGLLLGMVLPLLGRLDEAEERLEQTGRLCEAKGDELHLAGVWCNRACLWIARNDRERFMQDNDRVLAYARRLGNVNLERFANINCAVFLHWRGEFGAAEPFARRCIALDERTFGKVGSPPMGAVLLARILWCQGSEEASARLVHEVREHQATARAQGKNELLLQPNDELLLDMASLMVGHAGLDGWEPLVQRARTVAQGQELIEVLEMAGLTAQRQGDLAAARRWWQDALAAGDRIPNIMSNRIRQQLTALESTAQPHAGEVT